MRCDIIAETTADAIRLGDVTSLQKQVKQHLNVHGNIGVRDAIAETIADTAREKIRRNNS